MVALFRNAYAASFEAKKQARIIFKGKVTLATRKNNLQWAILFNHAVSGKLIASGNAGTKILGKNKPRYSLTFLKSSFGDSVLKAMVKDEALLRRDS